MTHLTGLAEIERVAQEKGGRVLATALLQEKGSSYIVLVHLKEPHDDFAQYAVWQYCQWEGQPGYFGHGDYFIIKHETDAFFRAFDRFCERAKSRRDYLRTTLEPAAASA